MQINKNLTEFLVDYAVKFDATPFVITDLTLVRKNCIEFKNTFPNIHLYYAIKAYSAPELIRAIDDVVYGYDVASLAEIITLIDMGIKPQRLLYSNPVKTADSIKKSYQLGVAMFAAQSMQELDKIAINAPRSGIFIRVAMNDAHSKVPLGLKFGCQQADALDLLAYADYLKLRCLGITFHVGSQQLDPTAWEDAIEKAQKMTQQAKEHGLDLKYINIGGGFPAQYSKDDTPISKIARKVNDSITFDDIQYLAEPGRFIVADSSAIVSRVIGYEQRQSVNWIFLDVGLFQAFIGAKRFKPFPYTPLVFDKNGLRKEGKETTCVLTGPSCDSDDVILNDALLPMDIEIDDIIVFPNTGAYTVVYGSRFNGFAPPASYFKYK